MTPAQRHMARLHGGLSGPAATEPARLGNTFDRPPASRQSPAQAFRLNKLAALAIAAAGATTGAAPARATEGEGASEYQLLLAQLGNDLAELSTIKSVEGKIARKRDLVAAYDPHVEGVLTAAEATGKATQDLVFVEIMIWRLDLGDYDLAALMADHVLKHGLALPERYKRTAATLILEEPADAALDALRLKRAFPVDVLQRFAALTEGHDVNDLVRAKVQKALGLLFLQTAESDDTALTAAGGQRAAAAAALTHLTRALELNKNAGVLKQVDRAQALVNRSTS